MTRLAGTRDGIFRLNTAATDQVLSCAPVRDLFRHGQYLYAGTEAGAYRSEDDGLHWQAIGLKDHQVWQIRAGDAQTLYAGTQPAGLFRSTDDGAHWAPIDAFGAVPWSRDWSIPVEPPLPGRARTVVCDASHTPARLRVGVEVGGIMLSDDAGETWTQVRPGDVPDIHVIVPHPADPQRLFVSTGYGRPDGIADMVEGNAGMFRSTDGGRSWTYVWAGVTPRYTRPLCIDPRAPYPLTVACAPNAFSSFRDPGGAGAALMRSDDDGDHWLDLGDPAHSPAAANFHGLAPSHDAVGSVIVGTDSGEVWLVNQSAEWLPVARGLPPVLSLLDLAL